MPLEPPFPIKILDVLRDVRTQLVNAAAKTENSAEITAAIADVDSALERLERLANQTEAK